MEDRRPEIPSRGLRPLVAALILALGAAAAAACEPQDCRWTLRGFALALSPKNDQASAVSTSPGGAPQETSLSLDGGAGGGVSAEYRLGPRLGLVGSVLYSDLDVALTVRRDGPPASDSDKAAYWILAVGPSFHVRRSGRVDLFLGPIAGFADFSDGIGDVIHDEKESTFEVFGDTFVRDLSDGFFLGAQFGLDVRIGAGATGLHLGVRYLDLATGAAEGDFDVDPIVVELGLAHGF